jgi:hypothetical protein
MRMERDPAMVLPQREDGTKGFFIVDLQPGK